VVQEVAHAVAKARTISVRVAQVAQEVLVALVVATLGRVVLQEGMGSETFLAVALAG